MLSKSCFGFADVTDDDDDDDVDAVGPSQASYPFGETEQDGVKDYEEIYKRLILSNWNFLKNFAAVKFLAKNFFSLMQNS